MKRLFDVFASALALAVLFPLLLVLAILVRIKLGSPVLFRQERAGLRGKPFHIIKFRTMTDECGSDGVLLPDAKRVTSFGSLLRTTSLDELPELMNVLCGDMSLVGPRPLPTSYLPRYSAKQARRHDVLPGLTGWAQINGRNSQSWTERFDFDLWYVENRSLMLDLKIIGLTFSKVIRRDGINAEGETTMKEFTGSEE